ncbi:MAG TPA: hypothetical protein PLI03_10210, partial [Chitinophagales bacterium]|nr:hypothetical protein [Chitinophagales bacterium]
MKRILPLVLLLTVGFSVLAQPQEFSYNHEDFLSELGPFMRANGNEEGRLAFEEFKNQMEKKNLTDLQVEQFIDLCNAMLG